jgi:hypothetical protein
MYTELCCDLSIWQEAVTIVEEDLRQIDKFKAMIW